MVKGSFWQSAALAALAASAAMVAVPAQAQDARIGKAPAGIQLAQADGRGRWQGRGDDGRSAGRSDRSWRGGGDGQARAQPRQEQRAAPVQAPQQRATGDGGWRGQRPVEGGRTFNGSNGDRQARSWNGQQVQAREARQQGSWRGQARDPQPGAVAGREWSNRNERGRGYDDRGRNVRHNGGVYRNDNQWRNDNRANYRNSYRNDQRGWNNGWRQDRRYDWRGYRNSNRSVYRLGTYYSPYRNYSYRRLSAGLFLDSLFYGQRYWISDPWQYRLPEVYGPYRWVRYYDDVLLIDVYSGEVVDAIHDFFW